MSKEKPMFSIDQLHSPPGRQGQLFPLTGLLSKRECSFRLKKSRMRPTLALFEFDICRLTGRVDEYEYLCNWRVWLQSFYYGVSNALLSNLFDIVGMVITSF